MNASVITVGTELLFGQIVNTNAAYISRGLQLLGIDVLYHYTVGDNPGRMRATIGRALTETDLVILTGGLGPTQDDLTKEVVAELMGVQLVPDQKAFTDIAIYYKSIGREMTENNRKQAMNPQGATVFYNTCGTAPGFALRTENGAAIALPGPPSELAVMFEKDVVPWLEGTTGSVIFHKTLRFYGIGESKLETVLRPLIDGQTDPTFATYAKEGECSLRIASKRGSRKESEDAVMKAEKEVLSIVGDYLYSDRDEEMSVVTARTLLDKGTTLASAESCTGGLFAATFGSFPGIAQLFDHGYVTHSIQSITETFDIQLSLTGGAVAGSEGGSVAGSEGGTVAGLADRSVTGSAGGSVAISEGGAVAGSAGGSVAGSEEIALAMAVAARKKAGTDIGVSVAEIAAPDEGAASKPARFVWMAIADADGATAHRHMIHGTGTNVNQRIIVLAMINMLREYLNSH
jgi:nicotinamide-nucleotide amidase